MSLFSNIDASDLRFSQSLCQTPFQSQGRSQWDDHDTENRDPHRTENRNFGYDFTPGSQGHSGVGDRGVLGGSNGLPAIPAMATTPGHRLGHSQGSSLDFADFGELAPASTTLLGRRKRTDSAAEWSPPTKARLKTYANDIAGEYGVPESSREEFISASMLPTHKLLIVTLAVVLGQQEDGNPTLFPRRSSQIRGVLLDPKLPSYKTGFLDRLMRHIRLNPGVYHIPQEFRAKITTREFNSAVSKAATTARADLKRKMWAAWSVQTSIYDLVKTLFWKSSQEMTDAIWARFAWVQMKLVDYKAEGGKEDGYWDYIDKELADRRAKALEFPVEKRAAFSSYVFEEALKAHLLRCKPKQKKKSSTQLPKWQQDISRAVEEMESYTLEDLAEEEDLHEQDPDDDPDAPSGPSGTS
ncbi:hypothetical protein B0H10DRAFT_2438997 [Mycena sp. CBHHK59/15]|nr:hypothetical protein B0H10DRAFT_2438997 [Mycena sp. CBHHK59/15]